VTIRFSARARAHLMAIEEYIRERNPSAAARVGHRIREAADLIGAFPYAGRPGRSPNTREYLLVYQVAPADPAEITVLGVFHCAQDPRRR